MPSAGVPAPVQTPFVVETHSDGRPKLTARRATELWSRLKPTPGAADKWFSVFNDEKKLTARQIAAQCRYDIKLKKLRRDSRIVVPKDLVDENPVCEGRARF